MKKILLLGTFIILTSCQPNSYCKCEDFIKKIQSKKIKLDTEMGRQPQILSWFGICLLGEELAETDKEKACFEYMIQMNDLEANKWMQESRCYDQSSTVSNISQ